MFPNINNMKIYLVCGKTDLRKGIDGLAALVIKAFSLDAYDNAIFLFCRTCSDRFKALYWDKTGFVLYYTSSSKTDAFSGREIRARSKR